MANSKLDHQLRLNEAFGVDEATLAQNRAGIMTHVQRVRLSRASRWLAYLSLAYGVVFLVVLAVLFMGMAYTYGILRLVYIGFGLLVLVSFGLALRGHQRFVRAVNADLDGGQVTSARGVVKLTYWRRRGQTDLWAHLKLDGSEYPLRARERQAFVEGGRYRIYVAPRSRFILAAEDEK